MDSDLYCNILNDELKETLEYYGVDTNDIIFQQDNNPKHKSCNELWDRIAYVWNKQMTKEYCEKLIESMPCRIEACYKAKGGSYEVLNKAVKAASKLFKCTNHFESRLLH
ncbi:hypothetical protein K492DRAFT_129719 [Lichtheimia hyalospora FSU 10163]|nr:hypothetical protein K492DRAFT_129719 [Lichtheimia hyalospora FSU 10163]